MAVAAAHLRITRLISERVNLVKKGTAAQVRSAHQTSLKLQTKLSGSLRIQQWQVVVSAVAGRVDLVKEGPPPRPGEGLQMADHSVTVLVSTAGSFKAGGSSRWQ